PRRRGARRRRGDAGDRRTAPPRPPRRPGRRRAAPHRQTVCRSGPVGRAGARLRLDRPDPELRLSDAAAEHDGHLERRRDLRLRARGRRPVEDPPPASTDDSCVDPESECKTRSHRNRKGENMSKTLVLVGTRKGAFLLESDADRRDWKLRGPYCEGWPVYHAVHDAGTGAIYAAAASEWHGSAVWRSNDLGETWALSSEGLAYDADDGRKVSKVSTLAARNGRVLVGVEAPGIFESKDGGETWSLLSTLAGQPGSEVWDDPANQPPGHLGISALMFDDHDDSRFWAIVQGIGAFETTDDGTSWTPRNRGL